MLDEREPVLLVIDDVWEEAQLRPFRFGGRTCSRLVTTRVPELLSGSGLRIAVDEMSADQARKLVAGELAGLSAEVADRLARLAGRWPVLLNLINGVLRRRVAHGQPLRRAAETRYTPTSSTAWCRSARSCSTPLSALAKSGLVRAPTN